MIMNHKTILNALRKDDLAFFGPTVRLMISDAILDPNYKNVVE